MRAAIFQGKGTIVVQDRPKPTPQNPTDAVVRVVLACVCGSDLWFYRGISDLPHGGVGHEFIGVVDQVGSDVTDLQVGDFVLSPFSFSDGTCRNCQHGVHTACIHGGFFGQGGADDGGQAEYVRVPHADGTLVAIPGQDPGQPDRHELAREFGATDIIDVRGDAAIDALKSLTNGFGADAVLECVGTDDSTQTAFAIAAPGAIIGRVGVPHGVQVDAEATFYRNVGMRGGPAPARAYQPDLLKQVLEGAINPGRVFDATFSLEDIAEAYAAMDERRAIKALIKVSDLH